MNLLGPDLLAEVTVHLTADDKRKAIVSKLDDDGNRELRQKVVQALIFTAIDVAKERGIGINWAGFNGVYPWQPPPAPTTPAG